MVAAPTQALTDAAAGRARLRPLTVEQYHEMLAHGILEEGDPIELLDGLLMYIDRSSSGEEAMTVSPLHSAMVSCWLQLAARVEALGFHIRLQCPITLPPHHEPEPDVSLIRGVPGDYLDHHPDPADVACVVEVADSSLERDRRHKQHIYASAGIPQYLIVNLVDRTLEVFEHPDPAAGRYREHQTVGREGSVRLAVGKGLTLAAEDVLPSG